MEVCYWDWSSGKLLKPPSSSTQFLSALPLLPRWGEVGVGWVDLLDPELCVVPQTVARMLMILH